MRLIEYVEERQSIGKLWFLKSDALDILKCSKDALRKAIHVLTQKKRLAPIRDEFVLIIPFEYKTWGIMPANCFIDPLMKYLEIPYYIALLSAAQKHGASHQKPMQFQVITSKYIRDIKYGRVHIRFLQSDNVTQVPVQRMRMEIDHAMVSAPEATAFDLCKYYKASGYWSNIATVILELLEVIDINKLCNLAVSGVYDTSVIQRLGFVLAHPDVNGELFAEKLHQAVNPKNFRWVPLNPGQEYIEGLGSWIKNEKWKILINEDIEADI